VQNAVTTEPTSRRDHQGLGCTSNVDPRAVKPADGLMLEMDRDPRLTLSPKEDEARGLPDRPQV